METDSGEKFSLSLPDLKAELSVLFRADGSCAYAQGFTSLWASVFGPGDCKASRQLSDRATLEVNFKPIVSDGSCVEHSAIESAVFAVLDSVLLTRNYPRTMISFTIQEFDNDGCLLPSAVNAACLAALDAGLPMKCAVAAVSCCLTPDGDCVLNPPTSDAGSKSPLVTVVTESRENKVIWSDSRGVLTATELRKCVDVCSEACRKIFDFYRLILKRKYCRMVEFKK